MGVGSKMGSPPKWAALKRKQEPRSPAPFGFDFDPCAHGAAVQTADGGELLLGPPARCPTSLPFLGWEASPTKIDKTQKIVPTYSNLSNLEDLVSERQAFVAMMLRRLGDSEADSSGESRGRGFGSAGPSKCCSPMRGFTRRPRKAKNSLPELLDFSHFLGLDHFSGK